MKSLLTFLIFLTSLSTFGQERELGNPIVEIEIENRDLISIDTKDQIFVSTIKGDVYLFSPNGTEINLFSPPRQGKLSQLEAAWTVNIFSFSTDLQEYRVLDRFLNPLVEKGFFNSNINLAKVATLGNNNIVWIWDESDLSLKRWDYLRSVVLDSQPLNLILDDLTLAVTEIREFKNRLFMNVPGSGIFIFDNQGNLLQKIKLPAINRLSLYKEHLLWIESGSLMAHTITTNETHNLCKISEEKIEFIQIGQNRLILAQKDKILVYSVPDWLKNWK